MRGIKTFAQTDNIEDMRALLEAIKTLLHDGCLPAVVEV
jgi:hypothetical protein